MTPWQIAKTVAGALFIAFWLWIGYQLGGQSARKELADYRASVTQSVLDAQQKARKAEQAHAQALAQVAQQYEEEKARVRTENDKLVADLRAGTVKLHQRWQAERATRDLSGAVARAAEPDAAERDRQDSAARITAAGDTCDAQVRGLQEVVRKDRGQK